MIIFIIIIMMITSSPLTGRGFEQGLVDVSQVERALGITRRGAVEVAL